MVNSKIKFLKIKAIFKGDKNAFKEYMKDIFRGSRIRDVTFSALVNEFTDCADMYKDFDRAKNIVGSFTSTFEEYFNENLAALLTWQVPNKFVIEYLKNNLQYKDCNIQHLRTYYYTGRFTENLISRMEYVLQKEKDHAPIEALFTISEEIGLLGAKYLDYSLIKSKIGYALDSHKVGSLTIGAPAQNSLKFVIHGKKAHAGVAPETGINAIQIAANAISKMPMGRIDNETTCSIGIISGGSATNIVPDLVIIEGEVRSHNPEKLEEITQRMITAVEETVSEYTLDDFQATADIDVKTEYHSFRLAEDHPVVQLSNAACVKINIPSTANIGGGGSDVNIFNKNGLEMAICGTGMENVHTVDEYILLDSLPTGAKWVEAVIEEYSK